MNSQYKNPNIYVQCRYTRLMLAELKQFPYSRTFQMSFSKESFLDFFLQELQISNFSFQDLSLRNPSNLTDFFSHIFADHNRSLPAAHHGEVCDYYEQRRELPLPLYHKSVNKSALYTPSANIFLKLSFTAATSSW